MGNDIDVRYPAGKPDEPDIEGIWPRAGRPGPYSIGQGNEEEMTSNNRLQATTHKLSLCTPFRSLLDYRVQPVGRRLNRDVRQE